MQYIFSRACPWCIRDIYRAWRAVFNLAVALHRYIACMHTRTQRRSRGVVAFYLVHVEHAGRERLSEGGEGSR